MNNMEIKSENIGLQQPAALMPGGLTGEVKNVTGVADQEFLEVLEELMLEHEVYYLQLYRSWFGAWL